MSRGDWFGVFVGLAVIVTIGLLWTVLALKLEIVEQKRRSSYWQEQTTRAESAADAWRHRYIAFVEHITTPLVVHNGQLTTSDTLEELLDPPSVSEADRAAYAERVMAQMREERWTPVPTVDKDAPPVQRITDADVWDEDE